MFVLLRPQVAKHDSGFVVSMESRQSASLKDVDGTIYVCEMEIGSVFAVYKDTLHIQGSDGTGNPLSEAEKTSVTEKIAEGIRAMGSLCEVV